MKRKREIAILILTVLFAGVKGQQVDSFYTKQFLSQTDITVLFSFYTQDGNHSAVTGGEGTEQLQVYAPQVNVTHTSDTIHKIIANAGVDVITSASTDNIDFRMSSASRVDARVHGSIGYSYTDKKTNIEIGAAANLSMESDYTSKGGEIWLNWHDKKQIRQFGFGFQIFFDDLRWGIFDPDYKKPITLVYPYELRDTAWFSNYTRNSFTWSLNYMQVLSKRINVSVASGFTFQTGILSTPFHRIYFNDSITEKVENLPQQRFKFPLALSLNVFINKRWVLRNYYRFYYDNFGIIANTFSIESPVKISAVVTLAPLFRFYHQTASHYFKPYGQHAISDAFYTSDYDLSQFYSIQPGLSVRVAPHYRFKNSVFGFSEFSLRYSYYYRSDGLQAHILSTLFGFDNMKLKARRRK